MFPCVWYDFFVGCFIGGQSLSVSFVFFWVISLDLLPFHFRPSKSRGRTAASLWSGHTGVTPFDHLLTSIAGEST